MALVTYFKKKVNFDDPFNETNILSCFHCICTSCSSGTRSHRRLIFRIIKSHGMYTYVCVLCMKTIESDSSFECVISHGITLNLGSSVEFELTIFLNIKRIFIVITFSLIYYCFFEMLFLDILLEIHKKNCNRKWQGSFQYFLVDPFFFKMIFVTYEIDLL